MQKVSGPPPKDEKWYVVQIRQEAGPRLLRWAKEPGRWESSAGAWMVPSQEVNWHLGPVDLEKPLGGPQQPHDPLPAMEHPPKVKSPAGATAQERGNMLEELEVIGAGQEDYTMLSRRVLSARIDLAESNLRLQDIRHDKAIKSMRSEFEDHVHRLTKRSIDHENRLSELERILREANTTIERLEAQQKHPWQVVSYPPPLSAETLRLADRAAAPRNYTITTTSIHLEAKRHRRCGFVVVNSDELLSVLGALTGSIVEIKERFFGKLCFEVKHTERKEQV